MSEDSVDRKPWIVVEIDQDFPGFSMKQVGEAGDFKVQVEADEWIKNNIAGSKNLASVRRGKSFKAVVRTTEVDF